MQEQLYNNVQQEKFNVIWCATTYNVTEQCASLFRDVVTMCIMMLQCMSSVQQRTMMYDKILHFVTMLVWCYDNVTTVYNDVCTLFENGQQELCNDFITMYNVTEQCVSMLHDVIMMCTYLESYFFTLPMLCNITEQWETVCNITFNVTVMLQRCASQYNHVHSCYNVW